MKKAYLLLFLIILPAFSYAQNCVEKTVDFERGNNNIEIHQGQIIDYEYYGGIGQSHNFLVSARGSLGEMLVGAAIDTANPLSDNQEFITPGTGQGNSRPEYKALVLSEDGLKDSNNLLVRPRSYPLGGYILFNFANSVKIGSVRLLSVDSTGGRIRTYSSTGDAISDVAIPNLGYNSAQDILVDTGLGTRKLEFYFTGTAAVAVINYCEESYTTPPGEEPEQPIFANTCGDKVCQYYENAVICPGDCSPVCGNLVVEPGEVCDGNCPPGCTDCICSNMDEDYSFCTYNCTQGEQCMRDSDCSSFGSNYICSSRCQCIPTPIYCDVEQGMQCDASDSSACKYYEKCDLDPKKCRCIPDGNCYPEIYSAHNCRDDSDCTLGMVCENCRCTPRTPVCGDGIIDTPNSAGVYEQCEIGKESSCPADQYCNSNCQCEALICSQPLDVMFLIDPSSSMENEARFLCNSIRALSRLNSSDPMLDVKYSVTILGPLYRDFQYAVTHGEDGSAACALSGGEIPVDYTGVYDILNSCTGVNFGIMNVTAEYAACESWGQAVMQAVESNFWRQGSLRAIFILSDEDASSGNDVDSCNDDPRCIGVQIQNNCYLADNVCHTRAGSRSWCEQACAGIDGSSSTYAGKRLTLGYGGGNIVNTTGYYGSKDWELIQNAAKAANSKGIKVYLAYEKIELVTEINGAQVLAFGIMGQCSDCIMYHQRSMGLSTGGGLMNLSFNSPSLIFTEMKRICIGGCPVGTTLCANGICAADCSSHGGPMACIGEPNGVCETGEGCGCIDCTGERDSCSQGAVCSADGVCGCPVGTTLCANGICAANCSLHGGSMTCIVQNGICEPGEGCDCSDCLEKRDGCVKGAVCKNGLCELPVGCHPGTMLCADGTCAADCSSHGGPMACIGEPNGVCETGEGCGCIDCLYKRDSCSLGAICGSDGLCGCSAGTTLCNDGTCSYNCLLTDGAPKACIVQNGICEQGEGCACPDCFGRRDGCLFGALCSMDGFCSCPIGTTLCSDGVCAGDCLRYGGVKGCIVQNGICEQGEGCACPDCFEKKDSCADGSICDSETMKCVDAASITREPEPGDADLVIQHIVIGKPRIFDLFTLTLQIKNNLNASANNINVRLEAPQGIVIPGSAISISVLEPYETKTLSFEIYIRDYDRETLNLIASASAHGKDIQKQIPIEVTIPDFIIAPDPVQLHDSSSSMCLDFYYAVRKGPASRVGIEMEIIDPNAFLSKSLIVDYMSLSLERDITLGKMISSPYCLPYGRGYEVRGYLYHPSRTWIVETADESMITIMKK